MDSHTQQMVQYLNDAINQSNILVTVLDKEKASLNTGNPIEIEQLSQDKMTELKMLETIEKQRVQLLKKLSLNTDMQQYIKHYDVDKKINDLWVQLMSITQQCQEKNQGNGIIIELNRQRIQRSLDILRGNEDSKANTYSTSGKTATPTTKQTIARA